MTDLQVRSIVSFLLLLLLLLLLLFLHKGEEDTRGKKELSGFNSFKLADGIFTNNSISIIDIYKIINGIINRVFIGFFSISLQFPSVITEENFLSTFLFLFYIFPIVKCMWHCNQRTREKTSHINGAFYRLQSWAKRCGLLNTSLWLLPRLEYSQNNKYLMEKGTLKWRENNIWDNGEKIYCVLNIQYEKLWLIVFT